MGSITAPTAIVTGDHDGIVWTTLHAYGSAKLIPGATLTVLPGVGHSPHWADPDSVVAAVLSVAARAGVSRVTVGSIERASTAAVACGTA